MTQDDHAGVLAPPPLLTALCVAGAWLAHHFEPLPLLPDLGALQRPLYIVLFAVFVALGFAAVRELRRHGTSPSPYSATSSLVTSGVYRFSRNPIYLSFLVFVLSLAVAMNSPWFLLAAIVLFLLLHFGVVKREEWYLARKFGASYDEYRKSVRRWL
jgi:protein-S-isoprenylcysteine O-methyltransferase Ste14